MEGKIEGKIVVVDRDGWGVEEAYREQLQLDLHTLAASPYEPPDDSDDDNADSDQDDNTTLAPMYDTAAAQLMRAILRREDFSSEEIERFHQIYRAARASGVHPGGRGHTKTYLQVAPEVSSVRRWRRLLVTPLGGTAAGSQYLRAAGSRALQQVSPHHFRGPESQHPAPRLSTLLSDGMAIHGPCCRRWTRKHSMFWHRLPTR